MRQRLFLGYFLLLVLFMVVDVISDIREGAEILHVSIEVALCLAAAVFSALILFESRAIA
jgi:hypothetical protein